MTFRLKKLRELTLLHPPQSDRPAHLSAASGLVQAGSYLYVVADDELHLGVFPVAGEAPGTLLRLRAGALPDGYDERKADKPDVEALTLLPRSQQYPHGALLALGSGSRPNRQTAFVIQLNEGGAVTGSPVALDLAAVYRAVGRYVSAVNIEGATIDGTRIRLLQRGNKSSGRSAIIDIDLSVLQSAPAWNARGDIALQSIAWYDLPLIDGVPLAFSDGVTLVDGTLIFTAIAEDTNDSYADGRFVGAAIGVIDPRGQLRAVHVLSEACKIEGVDARVAGNVIHLLLVTDADDANVPASLYGAELIL